MTSFLVITGSGVFLCTVLMYGVQRAAGEMHNWTLHHCK